MKNQFLLLLFFALLFAAKANADDDEQYLNSVGQQYSYIYTKGGQAVLVYINADATPSQKAGWLNDCVELFPNVTILGEATPTYNCHNYAWYMSDGHPTNKYWMDAVKPITKNANLSKFWTNDEYIETSSSVYDIIVYYDTMNTSNDSHITHSALVSSVPGYYESKWGAWPLVRHLPDDVPPIYGTTKRYFKPIAPTPIVGLIYCNNGTGTIGVNVSAYYYATPPNAAVYSIWSILNNHLEDAVAEEEAIISNETTNSSYITFTRSGIFDIYLKYYNKYGEMIGDYSVQAIVV